jgi:uncharacterized protein (DUF169 family)
MTQYESIAKTITDSLHLRVEPVAVSVVDRPPVGVPGPSQAAAAGCVFWERGAQGAFVTSAKDHENCAVGMYTHHLPLATPAQQENLNDSLKVFGDLGYVRPEDIPGIPVLKDEAKYIVYAPLASTPVPPAAVLLFANSRQSLAITEAVQQRRDSASGEYRQTSFKSGMLRSASLLDCADRRLRAMGVARRAHCGVRRAHQSFDAGE